MKLLIRSSTSMEQKEIDFVGLRKSRSGAGGHGVLELVDPNRTIHTPAADRRSVRHFLLSIAQ
jgi:hypothetical protein